MFRRKHSFLLVAALAVILAACGTAASVLSVKVTAERTAIEVGGALALSVVVEVTGAASKAVSWSSSDKDVAAVSEAGVVTANSAGSVTITATSVADESKQGSVELEVVEGNAVLSVAVTAEAPRLLVGEDTTLDVTVTVIGDASGEVRWASSDEDLATVSELGVVNAVAAGDVEITATSVFDETKTGSALLEVFAAPASDPATPGDTGAMVDGVAVTVTPEVDGGILSLAVGMSSLNLGVEANDGEALPIRSGGVPRVTADGSLQLAGSGYAPESFVDVWLFSDPTLLGTAQTDTAGEFSESFAMPVGVPVGAHTLVIQGTQSSGSALTLTVGLEVETRAAVVEFAHCPVNSDRFVSADSGADTATGTTVGAPFASIQAAVDDAEDHDVVCVAAGRYELDRRGGATEDEGTVLVLIESPLSLIGPNVGIRGKDERGPEAEMVVSGAGTDTLHAIRVYANDVHVDGFYITTESPMIDPFPNGTYGLRVEAEATANVSIRNSVLVDANYPIYIRRGRPGVPAVNMTATGNLILGPNSQSDQAIYFQAAFGEITDNVIRDARIGIQAQPYTYAGRGLVANNDMEVFQVGLWFNYQETANSEWVFSDNQVRGIESPWPWPLYTEDPRAWSGIRVETFYEGSVTFEGNSIASGEADPPTDGAVYLLRQRGGRNGEIAGIGTEGQLGEFFTANDFVDLPPAGVTLDDLSEDGGYLQLRLR